MALPHCYLEANSSAEFDLYILPSKDHFISTISFIQWGSTEHRVCGRFEVSSKNTVLLSLKHLWRIKKKKNLLVSCQTVHTCNQTHVHSHIYVHTEYIEPLPLGICHLLSWPKSLFRLRTNLNKFFGQLNTFKILLLPLLDMTVVKV